MRWTLPGKRTGPPSLLPPGRRIYAFGDVHGQAALLERLLVLIKQDLAARPVASTMLIGLGDYVDRGAASSRVLDLLACSSLPCNEHRWVRGNHEALLLRAADSDDVGIFLHWMRSGGRETVRSFGVGVPRALSDPDAAKDVHRDWLRAMPSWHLRLLRETAHHYAEGPYTFVHAGLRPGIPLSRQTPDDLLWIREPFLSDNRDFGTVVVHGHTPRADVENKPFRINIDTGAYATGTLTAVILEGSTRNFLSTARKETAQ